MPASPLSSSLAKAVPKPRDAAHLLRETVFSLFLLASKTMMVRPNDGEEEMVVALLRTLPLGAVVNASAEVRSSSSERMDFILDINRYEDVR